MTSLKKKKKIEVLRNYRSIFYYLFFSSPPPKKNDFGGKRRVRKTGEVKILRTNHLHHRFPSCSSFVREQEMEIGVQQSGWRDAKWLLHWFQGYLARYQCKLPVMEALRRNRIRYGNKGARVCRFSLIVSPRARLCRPRKISRCYRTCVRVWRAFN